MPRGMIDTGPGLQWIWGLVGLLDPRVQGLGSVRATILLVYIYSHCPYETLRSLFSDYSFSIATKLLLWSVSGLQGPALCFCWRQMVLSVCWPSLLGLYWEEYESRAPKIMYL